MTDRPTLRIAHLADTHLGYSALTRVCPDSGRNQRAVDIEASFATVIDDILARGDIDLVIHAGDVFHHSRPPMQTLIFFVRQMRRLEAAGIPVVVIGGNHDTPRLRHAGSVLDLCAIACNTVHFATGYEWERFRFDIHGETVAVTAVPHGAFTNEQPPDALPAADAERNLLVAHGSYNLEVNNVLRGGADDIGESLMDARYDYVALGHWHLHGPKGGRIYYSGSTERIGLGDLKAEPGYLRVALNGADTPEVAHVPVPSRTILALPWMDGEGLSADAIAAEIVQHLELEQRRDGDRFARAMVLAAVDKAPLGTDREVVRQLRGQEITKACWAFIPNIRTVRTGVEQNEEAGAIGQLLDEFAAFVEGRRVEGAYDPLFAASFHETGRTLLEEALRREDEQPTLALPPEQPAAPAPALVGGGGV